MRVPVHEFVYCQPLKKIELCDSLNYGIVYCRIRYITFINTFLVIMKQHELFAAFNESLLSASQSEILVNSRFIMVETKIHIGMATMAKWTEGTY